MPEDLDSQGIARRTFDVSRRGYEQQDVRAFLHEVSSLVDRLQREIRELRDRAERAEARLGLADAPDEAMLMEVLGEETTRVLTSAREAAHEIREKAAADAERVVSDAATQAAELRATALQDADRRLAEARAEGEAMLERARTEMDRRTAEADDAATRIRAEAAADAQERRDEGQRELERMRAEAEAELEAARARGREMVAEAQAVRERVLRDLSSRRKRARQQVEKLNAGRERLLEAYAVVRSTVDEATTELHTALSDARLAADAAARRVDEEPELTTEELDAEIAAAALAAHPIAEPTAADDHDHDLGEHDDEGPGPFSGEVPVVEVPEPSPAETPDHPADEPADLSRTERRPRIGRRRKSGFEGLPAGELIRVEPPAAEEGVRILADPTAPDEPEAAPAEPPAGAAPEADGASEPEPELETETETEEREGEPAPGPGPAEATGDGPAPGDAPASDDAPAPDDDVEPSVDDIFARLRGDTAEPVGDDSAPADDSAADAEGPSAPDEPAGTPEASAFATRDEVLEPIDKELGRRVKRTLADEQNEVLDLLRRAKPTGVDDLLPDSAAHAARWAEAAAESLADAAAAGAAAVGGKAPAVADLADELARAFTAPLRDRIERSFAASDGNLDDVTDRVRALYREWKGTRLTDTCRHHTAAAYARGLFGALPGESAVHWVLDPQGGTCPDCDDNVLGGVIPKGDDFPTGHSCAPAHPGCRCLVLPASA